MKKIYFVFAICLLIVSCKNDAKSNETETGEEKLGYTESVTVGNEFETFSGMFLYLESEKAAVFQTAGSKMYGVVVDDQMLALNEQCKQFKNEDHNMIPVVIRGVRKPNPIKDAWEEVIEIKQIVSVQKPNENQDGTIIIKNNQ
ncbi:hypothetical protein IMCC3317_33240 [Kordia antarctica]|uniref:Lipoprotein n=1 Tax=Kordia antarctica TaxID=1218801 RepID=A0A7L4ZN66_9FLAO|nr:hypothetical protein [Kordia antarctica]QHI37941.1 hypothetical protein IMCC3317_33240 [Kordia antarctica]